MQIKLQAQSRKEYLTAIASLFNFSNRQRDLFIGIISQYWLQGYFHCSLASFPESFSWAGTYKTILTAIRLFCKLGLLTKDQDTQYLYRINPDILINNGTLLIEILISRDKVAETVVNLFIPVTYELPDEPVENIIDTEYINPRYAHLVKKDLEVDEF